MNLDDVNQNIQRRRRPIRRGRGPGSTLGKTAGRGHKGQRSRAGFSMHPTFEGGQMPLVMRVAKRGFHNQFGRTVLALNVDRLEALFSDGDEVSPETLRARRIYTSRYDHLKILGRGEITKKLNISAHSFSESAVKKIEAAGGSVTRLPGKAPVPKNRYGSKKAQAK